ncbi:MAG: hypothetical protein LBF97_03435, partial [Elusimicrobiota bacterium]|nr:hypothetical protein [Elusimicrobiota bacterium]
HKRLECHHKIDRNYNEINDLIILCPSCHKKEHYKNGRNKKGNKGKLIEFSKIVSITKCEPENTYDIEMADPFHTILVNNILGCNSHAYAYSYLGVETLYLARYFKQYFYSAALSYESTKKDVLKDAINASVGAGYTILPPDVNISLENFTPTKNKEIRFGLQQIKGIGEKPLESIISQRPYSSIIDFILKHLGNRSITKRITTALIYSGAFDTIIKGERVLYGSIAEKFYESKTSTKIIEKLELLWNQIENDFKQKNDFHTSNDDLIKFEQEYLDGNFFHSIFTPELCSLFKKKTLTYSLQRLSQSEKKNSMVPLYVKLGRLHKDKNGNEMAFVDVEDMNGLKESLPIFASYWQYISNQWTGEGFYGCLIYEDDGGKYMFGTQKYLTEAQKARTFKRLI